MAKSFRLFVTGTDTDIGKTVIAAILTSGLEASYWKPIQSGRSESPESATDSLWVKGRLNLQASRIIPEAYKFDLPASPHLSASHENVTISTGKIIDQFRSLSTCSRLIIEGAGGVMVPLNNEELLIDVMESFAVPILLVASTRLGTINHTLLTVEALQRRNLAIAGIVMNGEPNQSSKEAIERFTSLPVVAEIPQLESTDGSTLQNAFVKYFANLECFFP